MGWCRREEINVWFKRKGNTAIKLKQGRRGVEGVGQRLCWVRESKKTVFALSIPSRMGEGCSGSVVGAHQQQRWLSHHHRRHAAECWERWAPDVSPSSAVGKTSVAVATAEAASIVERAGKKSGPGMEVKLKLSLPLRWLRERETGKP